MEKWNILYFLKEEQINLGCTFLKSSYLLIKTHIL